MTKALPVLIVALMSGRMSSLGGILRTLLGFSRASTAQIGGLAPIATSGGEAGRRSMFLNGEAVFNTDESFPAHL